MNAAEQLGVVLIILSLSFVAQAQTPPADTNAVEEAARQFVEYAHQFDYPALRAAATDEFEMLFDGRRMTLDGFEDLLGGMEERREGRKLGSYDLLDLNIRVVGEVAYTSWASSTGTWFETIIFVWSGNEWLVDRASSMRVRPVEP